jgi:hypothetical protein
MATGLGAASAHAQTSSEGGTAAALANAQRRRNEDGQSAYTIERLEGDNMPYARGLGLGVYTKPKPRAKHKPKHDPAEIARRMDDAMSEFFEGGKQLLGRGKGKARLAESMGLDPRNTAFSTAWNQRMDNKFRRAK